MVSTASPFKFCDSVLDALGIADRAAGTGVIGQLAEAAGQPAPRPLAELAGRAVRFEGVTDPAGMAGAVRAML